MGASRGAGGSLSRASHVMVKVDDLARAVSACEKLGFTMVRGAERARAHNALTYVADGKSLERFQARESPGRRWPHRVRVSR